jgi:hypothetical protein
MELDHQALECVQDKSILCKRSKDFIADARPPEPSDLFLSYAIPFAR